MAQSLSAATGSEIERVTRLCQRLEFFVSQPPVAVRALSHGDSNQSYHVKTAQGDYVLRCYPAHSTVCRQQELRCQHAAAAQGLAPAPLCLNNHYQIMLSDYIPDAIAYSYPQLGIAPLLQLLVPFHLLQVQTPLLDYSSYLQQLQQAVAKQAELTKPLFAVVCQAAARLSALPVDEVLCHMDLHQGNLLWAENKLWLLDFEYSQRADSSLDLAALCLHFKLDTAQQSALLQQYAQLRQQPDLLQHLTAKLPAAKVLYAGFCWLWYLAQPGCQAQAAQWQLQLQQLQQPL
ncbi:phosphotransferase [Rheinheimera muenzenbergensis]|uniref:Phosphotransferase n=1 Tax=Rheinheimera muenzenbergensis TaxID=1193628 RepID=A0ABU8C6J3_9GAMM